MQLRKTVTPTILFILVFSTFGSLFSVGTLTEATDPPYMWVLVQTKYPIDAIRAMLNDLGNVQGLVLIFEIEDNNTASITKVVDKMTEWFAAFPEYKIDVQITYLFADRYGNLLPEEQGANWVLNSTACFSDSFMTEYYGALANVFSVFRNVVLFTGFNEPYNHFSNKYLAQEVIKKEYTTFKSVCSWVPFSTEFGMAGDFWENFLGFPQNVTVGNDIVPYWSDYSDYVGFNLWVDKTSPTSGYDPTSQARFINALAVASEWSAKLNKPIHINEFPCWYKDRVETIVKDYMIAPNVCAVYQLCFPDTGAANDGWEYALYNLNSTSNDTTYARNPMCYDVYNAVFDDLNNNSNNSNSTPVYSILLIALVGTVSTACIIDFKRKFGNGKKSV
jgi:hypothetical protein